MATISQKNPDGTYTTYDSASYTPPVAAPSPISINGLTSTETPAHLPPQPGTPDYTGQMASIPSVADLTAGNSTPSPTEAKQGDLASQLEASYAKLGTKGAEQSKAEAAAGLPAFQSQLTDINGQIQALQKEALAIPLQIQNDAIGVRSVAGSRPLQETALRNNAIKALSLSAIAQTLQGNVALAQAQANKAIEAEFGPEQAKIEYLTKALDLNSAALNREDKKKADTLSIQLQERQRQLDTAKDNRNIIIGWAAEASKNGASSYDINQALSSADPNQALQILRPYFADPNEKAQALADLDYKRAQTAAAYAAIGLTKAQTTKAYADAQTKTLKPSTGAEKTNLGFYNRAKDAVENITPIETKLQQSLSKQGALQFFPNLFQSADQQVYRQAQRQFTEARLRKESGAAIPPAEYENDAKTYFLQPGDSAEVLKSKIAGRAQVLNSLGVSAGSAFDEYYGQPYPTPANGNSSIETLASQKGFDVAAARKAGYTDEEIAAYLNR